MMARLLRAVAFVTLLPARQPSLYSVHNRSTTGQGAFFLPLLGAAMGWVGAQWLALLSSFGTPLAAVAVLVFWAALTGGRNETALARRFTIWAAVLAIAVRWQALTRLPEAPGPELTACLGLSQAAMVAQAWVSRPVDGTSANSLPAGLTTPVSIATISAGVALAFLPGARTAAILLAAAVLMTYLLTRWFDARDGGVTGDDLRSTALLVETLCLVALSYTISGRVL